MGRKKVEEVVVDPSAWMLANAFAEFVLFHTDEIKYMCMLGYTFMHGSKVFAKLPAGAATTYKFVNLLLASTGGGILVPILINGIPVPLAQDSYPIAILCSYLLHSYVPIVRDVFKLSKVFKAGVIILYETMRAFVVCKLTIAAGNAIAPSEFDFPIFGPIFCGTLAGCGGAFLPMNKGLDPIKAGLAQPMLSAFIGATSLHLFLNTSLSEGIIDGTKKAKVCMAAFFILHSYYENFFKPAPAADKKKTE
ncbi:expressed unknown protein [Seminavis robusta]|uniref:Uncharacterized protein n=1 Tax=Seminavis robusta TaxID=568900 RepID=A0A9N8H5L8_9STRA|nr:expressed unknown protein [Seminavis robusta]|eukprot:Sro26_g017610.1 n/a (250) ;mRNA; r:70551-71479